ncbi:efflux RND transporter permease subunit [Fulvivirgaceae bacterium BMA10]|uniref:Efflux RND transporter permease subunit n=1 Tax=Splendidivirga corallicola TaxID=3051826 RepID=A0ABT8KTI0_9BACT|nr:efflux RND transporter permease subunit [Fulvivirgaceae bacterium BMA10]
MSGIAGNIAKQFINSKLTPLLMIAFMIVGVYSATLTPKEEEPQIDVPIADIFLEYPGASAKEVESRVVKPLEQFLADVPGVEYVYSQSMEGQAFLVVRYYVGEDVERSIVKLYNELQKHADEMPVGVGPPLVKTRSIDDVPVLGLTLWSEVYDDFQLRRMAQELTQEIEKVEEVSRTRIHGGRSRQIQVILDRERMAAYQVDPNSIRKNILSANQQRNAGSFISMDKEYLIESGEFLKNTEDVENLVIGVHHDRPVYLRQVAAIIDGPELPKEYVSFGFGGHEIDMRKHGEFPAVTISVAKRKGADAMQVADLILDKIDRLDKDLVPQEVNVEVTRNYGETASHKVQELILHLVGAIIAVTIVVALSMGWRGGFVVFLSVPITFALTLFIYYIFGYTLNRITLFALVFVTGIVVDDSIIVAENMHRHFKMRKRPFLQAAIASINEIGNPTILATFTVIAAVLPMIFVSGLMGPYMSPMPIGASLAMIFSLLVALIVTPWLAYRFLKHDDEKKPEKVFVLEETRIYRLYKRIMEPMLLTKWKRWTFIGSIAILTMASFLLVYFKLVPVKMLPFDNKNEFQVVIDMPEGTTLERTAVVAKEIGAYLNKQPEVTNYQAYVGTSAPINFNGLVRHYDLRRGSNIADIQVNLLAKGDRSEQSHEIAKRIRPGIQLIAKKYQANVKVVEVPPGPPVISTIVAEIYGDNLAEQEKIAKQVKEMLGGIEDVVDVDWMVEDDQVEYKFNVDKERAMLMGVSPHEVSETLSSALAGQNVSYLYQENEVESVPIRIRLDEQERTNINDLRKISIRSRSGNMVSLGDLVKVEKQTQDKSIYRKNQKRVIYVTADVAGRLESPVYAILEASDKLKEITVPEGYELKEFYTSQPFLEQDFGLKWDGEWHITYEVFRDLGSAFAVVLIIIYLLIIGWFQDFKVPFTMLLAVPLSLVGILVGHWLLGAFFTATSMIGMIALAGIMVRNSILLIDFINLRLQEKVPFKQAVIEAGAVRTTPILLTAGTVVIGAFVILFDPIFQGLAISLMGGSIVSTVLTLIIVPLIYYITERKKFENRDSKALRKEELVIHSNGASVEQ